ncbi:hypothetical protein BC742_0528 [Coprobacter fastidiosus NSB1 = JCM 33896]|uniref:Uncharacterized protein n=1 Tax=Coprobacter fastidiosus NSB1 = JCM 33896 TaxID=1349822 RepID=A0A495WNV5_9BACT|nr:hypothetical protein BC742_0528 [Coprobacter fastidiosus NSB1 = JCM 33896]
MCTYWLELDENLSFDVSLKKISTISIFEVLLKGKLI